MKICLAYPNKKLTYSETFIKNHIDLLKHDFILSGGQWPFLKNNNVSIFKFPLNLNLLRASVKKFVPKKYHSFYSDSLKKFLLDYKINVVLAEYGPVGARMTDGCREAGIPLIVHFHGYDAFHYLTLTNYRLQYRELFEYAQNIIVVSDDMKNQLISIGAEESKIIKIPYGINTELFSHASPFENPLNFISVGRFTEKKAPDKTILAFREVCQNLENAQLFMIGDGELLNSCKFLVKKINLENKVIFLGVLKPHEIAEWHKKACCFVQHSVKSRSGDSEGLPNTILEALSSGLPVISTRHAGITEAVEHGYNGFLVEEGDIEGMASFMQKLVKDKNLIKSLSINARNTVLSNYSLTSQIEKLNMVLRG